jgi:hypothetical protein
MIRNHLGTFQVILRDDGSCTVPPNSRTDGEMAVEDCEYPDVRAALDDLYEAVIREEMPVRVTFEFSHSTAEVWEAAPAPARSHQTSLGRRHQDDGRDLWAVECSCGWVGLPLYGSMGAAHSHGLEHKRRAREVQR